jgi:hypothetical protein
MEDLLDGRPAQGLRGPPLVQDPSAGLGEDRTGAPAVIGSARGKEGGEARQLGGRLFAGEPR